uniref:Small ribosomal subunit protein uS3m n=1 Tax=Trametes coccinea TaxID=158605 RepID=A0A7S8WV14_TRACO|nr:ribosomal protein S3 [Trametes coccinea]QPF23658.1 ribosomal protein S3 [Trametes coccinea]
MKNIFPLNNLATCIVEIEENKKNKPSTGNRKGIRKSSFLDIGKYTRKFIKQSQSKESIILESKKLNTDVITSEIINTEEDTHKDIVSNKIIIDMTIPVPQSEPEPEKVKVEKEELKIKTEIQKYIKSFTTLDIELAQNKNTLYEFNSKSLNLKILNKNVYKILEYSFFEMSSLISTPNFYITPKNVVVNLFFFVINRKLAKKNFLNLNFNKLEGLSIKLSKYFKKPVQLELTQLYSVSNNSQILVNVLGKLGLSRRNSFSRIINKFLKYQSKKIFFRRNMNKFSKLTTLLTGVNIKLGGRLMKGKIVPRRTVKKIQHGSLARSKSNYITTARLTQKNKRGSFSFTVSIGHRFF